MKRTLILSLVIGILVLTSASASAQGGYTDVFILNTIFGNTYTVVHETIKGYSAGSISPNFYSNDWDGSWSGNPLSYQPGSTIGSSGLTPEQITYLSGLSGLPPGILYSIDLLDKIIVTGTGPVTNTNAAESGFHNYTNLVETGRTEDIVFTPDPLDPFNIIRQHYINIYEDRYDHTFMVLGAFNDLTETDPGTEPVPEPATMFLISSGLVGIAAMGRRRSKGKTDLALFPGR